MTLDPKAKTAVQLVGVVVVMGALAWAAVPFYDWFCRVTGFGGTTGVAEAPSEGVLDQTVTVRFDASKARGMPWDFRPVERQMKLRIGETGLDFHYDQSPRDIQATLFRRHIAAARETGLPLIVHARAADDEMIEILRDETAKGAFPGVLHCFSSGPELARAALAIGFYISFSGILTFKKADEVREVAAEVPLDRMLVETNAPYLAPVPHRGNDNEQSFVAHTAV